MPTLTIILDTNEYIFGLKKVSKGSVRLLQKLSYFKVKAPRLILEELHRNLDTALMKELYGILLKAKAEVVEERVSNTLVKKYENELPYEDAVIASYCEHLKVDFLISENRHFLVGFKPKNFKVFSAEDFLKKFSRKA